MERSRLTLAIQATMVTVPDGGEIVVFNPAQDNDLSALPKDRVTVVQGFHPDHEFFLNQGYKTEIAASGVFSLAIVCLPRSKQLARNLIEHALAVTGGGPVVIDGQKNNGIESILKNCRSAGGLVTGVFSKAHGKIFTLSGGDFSSWAAVAPGKNADGFITGAGVFSADGVDKGSALLAAALPDRLSGKLADLGAGWGYLSHHILKRSDVSECHLIEAEHSALDCARQNITDPRARFHWGDARKFTAKIRFDTIITNPPFHTSRVADPALGRDFIEASARLLSNRGVVWLVANRHLPYEQHLSALFKEVTEVAGDTSFKVIRAKGLQTVKR
ncbi:MAG: methyltransferase [Paracoccaceae bacterium]